MRLVNVTSGRLASLGVVSNITILANDDPYGAFEFEPSLVAVDEMNENITVHVVRRQGIVGRTRVYYASVPWNTSVDDIMYIRAKESQDYLPVSGFIDFQPNQTMGTFVLTIMDDVIPEGNETIVVNLTSVKLLQSQGLESGKIDFSQFLWPFICS